jgi:hypothetical protein
MTGAFHNPQQPVVTSHITKKTAMCWFFYVPKRNNSLFYNHAYRDRQRISKLSNAKDWSAALIGLINEKGSSAL